MTEPLHTEPVEVTQAAREVAAQIMELQERQELADLIRAGDRDSSNTVQICTRFEAEVRTAAEAASRQEVERLPEYGDWLPDVWEAYLFELCGYEHRKGWAHLPATFRWHEFHERLQAAINAERARAALTASEAPDA